jgi:hypothetical protein
MRTGWEVKGKKEEVTMNNAGSRVCQALFSNPKAETETPLPGC